MSPAYFTAARAVPAQRVRVVEMTHDDSWMRDVGPTCVVNRRGSVRGVDWHFNAWGGLNGGLYFPWDQDDLVARKVLEIERCGRYRAPLVNEGGAIHVDGEGTALVTEECLLNPNRNPGLSRQDIERALREYLGVSQVIWLGRGVVNDDRRPRRYRQFVDRDHHNKPSFAAEFDATFRRSLRLRLRRWAHRLRE